MVIGLISSAISSLMVKNTDKVSPKISHQEALNKIMSCACPEFLEPEEIVEANGIREYWITLHCSKLLVKAKPLPNNNFEIISIQKECEFK